MFTGWMKKMSKLSLGTVKVLLLLKQGNTISGGEFNKFKKYLADFILDEVLISRSISRTREKIQLSPKIDFDTYLLKKFGMERDVKILLIKQQV